MISLHVDDSVVMVVTNVTSHVQRSCEAKVVICLSRFPEYFLIFYLPRYKDFLPYKHCPGHCLLSLKIRTIPSQER